MTDISLNRPGPAPSPGRAGASPASSIEVVGGSASVARISAGSVLKGVVGESPGRDTMTILTDKGSLTLRTSLAVAAGSTIAFQLQSMANQTRVSILAVNGQPPRVAARQMTETSPVSGRPSAEPGPGKGPAPDRAPFSGQAAGRGGTARPDPSAARPLAAPPEPGKANITALGEAQKPSAAVAASSAASPLRPGATIPAVIVSGSVPPILREAGHIRSGDTMTVKIVSISSPGAAGWGTDPGGSLRAPYPLIQATVRGPLGGDSAARFASGSVHGSTGGPAGNNAATILQIPHGRLAITTAPPLAAGTRLVLEIADPLPTRHSAAATPETPRQLLGRMIGNWPALETSLPAMLAPGPAGAGVPADDSRPAGLVPPRPGPSLAAGIAFFLSALRGGDLAGWLGKEANGRLDAGDGDLKFRLGEEFTRLGRLAAEPQPSGWHTLLIPILVQERLHQVRMFFRHQSGEDEIPAERFVVQATLARFGMIELDGLLRPATFDLVMRSERGLPAVMEQDIRTIHLGALEIGGFTGSLRFETGIAEQLGPINESADPASGGMMV